MNRTKFSNLKRPDTNEAVPKHTTSYYYYLKLALTSPTSGGRSVGIVRLRIKAHGVFFSAVPVIGLVAVGLAQK
jgi:hypothetical protein